MTLPDAQRDGSGAGANGGMWEYFARARRNARRRRVALLSAGRLRYPYAAECPVAGAADAVDRWEMDEYNFPGLSRYDFDQRRNVSARGAVFIYVLKRA